MKLAGHTMAVDAFVSMLTSLSKIIDKAEAQWKERGLDPNALVTERLAPDMLDFTRQIQVACDNAKNGIGRLIGKDAPKFEDNEKTIEELKARIHKTIAYLKSVSAADFEGAELRTVEIPLPRSQTKIVMNGTQYLRDWALPNFYFHVVTAYGILRHKGVQIGKMDYLNAAAPYAQPMGT